MYSCIERGTSRHLCTGEVGLAAFGDIVEIKEDSRQPVAQGGSLLQSPLPYAGEVRPTEGVYREDKWALGNAA